MTDNNFIPAQITNEGETHQLTVTSNSSVQPAILLRLGVFVPASRAIPKGLKSGIDVSSSFSQLEFARKEGYDEVRIFGERLNISTDFSVWMGIIGAFSKYGLKSNTIELPFTEFAALCQYDSRQFNKRLRDTIFDALTRIGTKTVLKRFSLIARKQATSSSLNFSKVASTQKILTPSHFKLMSDCTNSIKLTITSCCVSVLIIC